MVSDFEKAVSSGNLKVWPALTEEERYGVWSTACNRGGDWNYSEFCDLMDARFK